MTKQTMLRRVRKFEAEKQGRDIIPAFNREEKVILLPNGLKRSILVSHGQIINPRKVQKKYGM